MIPYTKHYITDEDVSAVVKVLESDYITQGERVAEFEQAIADYCDAKYAVAFSSGTAALHAACSLVVKEGTQVITTPLSFVSTSNAILYCGGIPVFVDVDDTLCLSADALKSKIRGIKSVPSVLLPVDFAGHPCDYNSLLEIGGIIIEDACHALGAWYGNRKIGSIADMTCFSFHPAKLITTGEGGMVTTDNENYYHKLKEFRNCGRTDGQMWTLGSNYRLTDFQCALGLSQMESLNTRLQARRRIAWLYYQRLSGFEQIKLPFVFSGCTSAWHIYPIRFPNEEIRNRVWKRCKEKDIGVQLHYHPIHLQPYYKRFGYEEGDFPIAEDYAKRALTIPLFPTMTDDEVDYVAETIRGAL